MERLIIDINGTYGTDKKNIKGKVVFLEKNIPQKHIYYVNDIFYDRSKALRLFNAYFEDLHSIGFEHIKAHKPVIFRSFFIPLFKWITLIDLIFDERKIEKNIDILFVSYCENKKISILEAEGESQTNVLYKSSYFLSFYLKKYLEGCIGCNNIKIQKDDSLKAKFSFYLRIIIFLSSKFFQQLIYKINNFLFVKKITSLNHNLILSRGVIQSQFFETFRGILNVKDYSVLVNESSIFPFRNLKYYKKTIGDYNFIEGNLKLATIINRFCDVSFNIYKRVFSNNNNKAFFCGVPVFINDLLPEVYVFQYYSETQGLTLRKTLNDLSSNKPKKIFCFDMLTPQPYYVKLYNNIETVQIQTTLMEGIEQCNFVFGDKFFFTEEETYNQHLKVNKPYSSKFDLLNNIKYATLQRKIKVKSIKKVMFFTQPIFIKEEVEMIKLVKKWTENYNFDLKLKLHPRSKKNDYLKLGVDFEELDKSSTDAINNADIVITRNSTIGLDAWMLSVPVIFLTYGSLKSNNIPYIPRGYSGDFRHEPSIQELDLFIENLEFNFYSHPYLNSKKVNVSALLNKLDLR
ncbi:hypothetical protein [Mesonia aquimarina]|uniref:hypothetical protein n=1 Tax=Mesonia aquimarina TaxID=1504967 RepID=UPI000EF5FDCB|nr:hypothetical protein [Mesonia aquimarina]